MEECIWGRGEGGEGLGGTERTGRRRNCVGIYCMKEELKKKTTS